MRACMRPADGPDTDIGLGTQRFTQLRNITRSQDVDPDIMRDADGHSDPRERVDLEAEYGLVILLGKLDSNLLRVVRRR